MMRSFLPLTLAAFAGSAVAAPASAPAASAAPANRGAITTACERATQQTLRDTRGATAMASFTAPPSVLPGPADAVELTLRGAGQVRTASGTQSFSYSCTYDTGAGAVAGVVVRDAGSPAQAAAARGVEPDLSHVSPAACESAAASALKRRWPNVATISFSAVTRQLSQDASGHASLRGQGMALPSVHDPATHFSYDCAIDPRSGRVTKVLIGD